ncbi:SirB2 family protein [Thermomonas sp.]|uniref:SirB2 family protein n=1 Tax=Thermomonas sp. TaxID=1971895 RepID=UPI002630F148|nr:SirB2 family protein [Thermomonas sp.]MCO5055992.1 SirB2 family protein [Thermomonas sp.]HRO62983.1 SirB2 family protein [Thermomonas sp.]
MALLEFYPQIKWLHVHAVQCSGLIFALRCGAALLGAKWPQHRLPKYGSYLVDTTLLATGLTLIAILPWGVFANGWLAVKLPLVVVYVALGVFAMRPKRTRPVRFGFYLAALATFGFIYGIARMHNPLGWLLLL